MKKFINSVDCCVDESLLGLVAANDQLRLIKKHRVVIRRDYEQVKTSGHVTLLAGGGSGHEPAFAGFVGAGMLTAAVAGSIFASPPATNILAALRLLGKDSSVGTVIIVANYTGDRLNFGLAAEQAKAEGHKVEMILVAEDCALVSPNKSAGRRGLCGVVLAMKIAGAMAESGCSLSEIVNQLHRVNENLGSIGLSLSPCSIPGSGPNFTLGPDEMELGLGVHGEAGVYRLKMQPAKEAVNSMLTHMTNPLSASCFQLKPGERVVLLVNNLGGTTNLELNIVTWEAILWLESRDIEVVRVFCGPTMTSLEMVGATINILKATDPMISYIDTETSAPGWPRAYQVTADRANKKRTRSTLLLDENIPIGQDSQINEATTVKLSSDASSVLKMAIASAAKSLLEAKDLLNDLDSGCGDGDCGSTVGSGAQAVLQAIEYETLNLQYAFKTMQLLANICQESMGGASGALYSIFFTAASVPLKMDVSFQSWCDALRAGTEAVEKYGGAKAGDRTMLDSLYKVVSALQHCSAGPNVLQIAADAAEEGAKQTAGMTASAGRASYVSMDRWNREDPGAVAVSVIFRAIANLRR